MQARLDAGGAARLARYDLLYFLMALLVLATGLLRLFLGAHSKDFLLAQFNWSPYPQYPTNPNSRNAASR
ncbi:hypothetical protein YWS52_32800 [Chitiniphilus shinanonensis]